MKKSAKIMIFVLSTTIVIFIATVSYIAIKSRDFTLENTKRLTYSYSREYAYLIKAELDVDLDVARTLAHSFLGQEAIPPELRKQVYNEMLIKVYENHFNYLAVWANWELFAYEPDYPSSYGRARSIVHIENDEKQRDQVEPHIEADPRRAHRHFAALVSRHLGRKWIARPKELRDTESEAGKDYSNQHEDQSRSVMTCHGGSYSSKKRHDNHG